MAGRRHGENAQRRAARELGEAGKSEANRRLIGTGVQIEVPLPCMCNAGVARTKAGHANPDYDGRHWHAGMWDEFERQIRIADMKAKER